MPLLGHFLFASLFDRRNSLAPDLSLRIFVLSRDFLSLILLAGF